jgi:hypothetical protein
MNNGLPAPYNQSVGKVALLLVANQRSGLGSTGSQGVDTEPHALASGPVLTRAVLPPEIPLSRGLSITPKIRCFPNPLLCSVPSVNTSFV